MQKFENIPTKINFDKGVISNLDVNKFQNVLVLTGAINSLNIFKKSIAPLIKTTYHLYYGISSNPTENTIYNITNYAREKDIDCILSIGGGAVMDCGRIVSLLLSHGGLLHEYVIGGTIGTYGISPNLIYHITVPTISGTGAEVSCMSTYNTHFGKKTIYSPNLFPHATYIDPQLMLGISQKLWTNIAFNCFVQALEAYVSVYANPLSDQLALDAMKLYLKVAHKLTKNTNSIVLIEKMVEASINSLMAVNMSSRGAVYAIAEAISSNINVNFGAALAYVCAEVCERNYEFNKEKYDEIINLITDKNNTGNIKDIITTFIKKIGLTVPNISSKLNDELLLKISRNSINLNMQGNPKMMSFIDVQDVLKTLK